MEQKNITITLTIEEMRRVLTALEIKMKHDLDKTNKWEVEREYKKSLAWYEEYRRTDLLHDKFIFACEK